MKLADPQDSLYMRRALDLAIQGQYTAHPNPRVGCVLVQDGTLVGEGTHWQTGGPHAEINALNMAKEKAQGATCYVTLEPCAHQGRTPPCIHALINAKVKRVVIAALDPNPLVAGKGAKALEAAGITVTIGVLEKEAMALNKGFYSRMLRKRPFVRAKIAMSLDGRVAMQNGESQWITSSEARNHGHDWRARSGAIITGADTVLQDDCRLTVRHMPVQQPLRVIIDSQLRVPENAAIFEQPGHTVVATSERADRQSKQYGCGVELLSLPEKNNHIDLTALLSWLAKREINDVLVEAGPTLLGAMLQQQLVDELLIYMAPKLLGNEAKGLADLPGIGKLSDHVAGEFTHITQVGPDLHFVLNLNKDEQYHDNPHN